MKILSLYGIKENTVISLLKEVIQNKEWDKKVFLMGGAVRDEIMGVPPKDLDFSVEKKHGGIEFANWLFKVLPKKYGLYVSHPVVYNIQETAKIRIDGEYQGVDLNNTELELVQTRWDVYETNNRKPIEVVYAPIELDLKRRDLSINAMAKNISTNELIDPYGGREDLKKGILRAPAENYDMIYNEDPLRILRAVRFYSKYHSKGFTLDGKAKEYIKKYASNLKTISKERIREELEKILLTAKPSVGLDLLKDLDLLQYVIPQLNKLINLKQGKYHDTDAWTHTLRVVDNSPCNLLLRLSALLHDVGKIETQSFDGDDIHFYKHEDVGADLVKNILIDLRYSNDVITAVSKLVNLHMRPKRIKGWRNKAVRKFIKDSYPYTEELLDLVQADNLSHAVTAIDETEVPLLREKIKAVKELDKNINYNKIPFPHFGSTLMKRYNLKPGKVIGESLDKVQDMLLDNPNMSEEDVFERLDKDFL